jgi:hypothetical protein
MNGRRIVLTTAAALALVAGGTAAGAAIASGPVDSSGVVHGCYTTYAIKGSHVFVLQDAGTSCPRGTTAIMWNQRGPQGPQGSPGPQGVAGPQGPAGTSGWSGQVQVTTSPTGIGIASAEILSQAGPSILSVEADTGPAGPGLIFTGDNLPTNMFPIAMASGNSTTGDSAGLGLVYVGWDTVANTSFEIKLDGIGSSETFIFNYFLPSD